MKKFLKLFITNKNIMMSVIAGMIFLPIIISVIFLNNKDIENDKFNNKNDEDSTVLDDEQQDNEEELEDVDELVNRGIKMNKSYVIFQVSAGGVATISFNKDGTCEPFFSAINNAGSLPNGGGNIYIFYDRNKQPCTYTIDNNIISVSWLGIYEQVYEYQLGTGQYQSSTMGSDYIMKDIKFQYYEDGDYIEAINGKWDIKQGESFYIVSFVSDESIDDSNNIDNSNNIDDSYDSDVEEQIPTKEEINRSNAKKEMEFSTIIFYENTTSVDIQVDYGSSVTPASLKSLKINGSEYPLKEHGERMNFHLDFAAGENCYTVELENIYGDKKSERECFNFTPYAPTFDIKYISECLFSIELNSLFGYNHSDDVVVTINDIKLNEHPDLIKSNYYNNYYCAPIGTYTVTATNRYGVSSSKEFVINSQCSAETK